MNQESVRTMWTDYHRSIGTKELPEPIADKFGDNEFDVNELADLANKGIKRATASSLWALEKTAQKIPEVGDIFVVTDWIGNAVCIVQTTKVTILPFDELTEAHALREGEGDKSLAHWRKVHIAFYKNELQNLGLEFQETMPIIFEEFEKIFP